MIALIFISFKLNGQFAFEELANFPGLARDDAFAVHHKGFIYAGFGLATGFFHVNDWWQYNLATEQWQQLTTPPLSPRQYVRGFVLADSLYLFGGQGINGEFYGDFWRYSFNEDEWQALAKPPLEARWAGVGFSLGNVGYLGLGFNGTENFNDFWAYHPAKGTWQQKASLPNFRRAKCYGLAINNRGLVGAGLIETTQDFLVLNSQYWYYPLSDRWEEATPLKQEGAYFYATSSAQNLLLLGGFTRRNNQDSLYKQLRKIDFTNNISVSYNVDYLPFRRGGNFIKVCDTSYFLLWGLDANFKRVNSFFKLTLNKPLALKPLAAYPNPTLNKSFWLDLPQTQRVQIFTLQGQVVFSQQQKAGLQLLHLPPYLQGLYILQAGNQSQKIWIK